MTRVLRAERGVFRVSAADLVDVELDLIVASRFDVDAHDMGDRAIERQLGEHRSGFEFFAAVRLRLHVAVGDIDPLQLDFP
jgi:hypothetical protein